MMKFMGTWRDGMALAVFALGAQPAGAHAAVAAADGAAEGGDAIVVSALRVPVEEDRVSSSVTVIDTAALQQAQPLALTDVLATTPGISVARNGGYGQPATLRIRGADPADTVVVIDGMRLADPTAITGGFDFSRSFIDDTARIEVLRGPQSILWGSDAIGGIVNITTVAPTRPLQADLSIGGGSHQTVDAHAGIGGTSALVDWRVSGTAFSTEGIPTLIGGTQPNGYTRQAASATTVFHLGKDVSLDLRGFWDSARNSFSDTFSQPPGIYAGDYALTKQWSAYAGLNFAVAGGRFKNRIAVLQNQTDNEDFYPLSSSPLVFVGHGRTRRYEYQGSFNAAKGVDLVFGAERAEQQMRVGSPYDALQPYDLSLKLANTNSVYGELRISPVAGLTLNGGVRYDHHSQFGGNTVFSAGAAYTPDLGKTLLRASYDEGFKAPSLYQLYSDYGAANLQPEHARGWEVGVQRSLFGKAVQLGAVWWQRRSTNLIGFAYCPYPIDPADPATPPACLINGYGYYANVAAASGRGLELTAQARAGQLYAQANYSIVVNEDRTPGALTNGVQLPRVPRHLFNGVVGYDLPGGVTTSIAVRWSGASFDRASSAAVLGGYAVVDWRAEWTTAGGVTLFGRVENLGDRQYQTAAGYNSLGRTAFIGLRGHF
ncbi:TonB-dependent receptor [Novosphingobium sp.]|uniref:TonB-dependent receptor plug domain-containing protein n=1 Tax=Novosphingobium sp. TaxID=1874826 RepID=UPI0033418980